MPFTFKKSDNIDVDPEHLKTRYCHIDRMGDISMFLRFLTHGSG
jgi:hypothetical protein